MNKRKYIISIVIIALLAISYFIADSILFDGVRPKLINHNGFEASYYVKNDLVNKKAIVLIGGGQWGDYWAREFANNGMAGLSLPYIGKEGLPKLPEEIDLAYFENAIIWLSKQKEVNKDKIVVIGASRNAELALLIASTFPELVSGVVAYSPSSVSWSNTVLPYNSDELKPSWIYKGIEIPYLPMEKITGSETDKIEMLEYWKKGLSKKEFVNQATIKAEKINGPILLFSGIDDKVWPSSLMADMIEENLKKVNFKYSVQNIKYENAGHLISRRPEEKSNDRTAIIDINGKNYEYEFGGTNEGDFKAKKDAKVKLMEFIKKL
ncbi:acyl-CoA thioester hydrolase/BAAT C-terminal domain-containing protein [Flagellimonas marinaquae]|uniref:acyl-CoA thioester hydrolase/BAAT C-terminal domain-containing protein n=1 Tax=Flagellimonas marinaquae TaxID=254955 RepID=UPI000F8E78B4|nr:acyl-CoA thioester hydrolase/BAAT C-terminal domain-containing protein [Allomuricauda aquimarina]